MKDISELIYETCKTYLVTQLKFILMLWAFIAAIIGRLLRLSLHRQAAPRHVAIILAFSLVGIAGSYVVAWFGIRVNTFANSRSAFAALKRQALPDLRHPAASAGMSIGTVLISVELLLMLCILLFVPRRLRRPLLHRLRHRRVAGRRGAAHRGRHLHQDRRHRHAT